MPFTDTPDLAVAALTDAGRNALARALVGEISFKLTSFAVGRSGYQDANPVKVMPLDTSLPDLIDQIFPTSPSLASISGFEKPYPKTLVVNCRLASTEAVSALGEIGIWGEIIYSPGNPSEVGTTFLFAVSHFPLCTKILKKVMVYRFVIQF